MSKRKLANGRSEQKETGQTTGSKWGVALPAPGMVSDHAELAAKLITKVVSIYPEVPKISSQITLFLYPPVSQYPKTTRACLLSVSGVYLLPSTSTYQPPTSKQHLDEHFNLHRQCSGEHIAMSPLQTPTMQAP